MASLFYFPLGVCYNEISSVKEYLFTIRDSVLIFGLQQKRFLFEDLLRKAIEVSVRMW